MATFDLTRRQYVRQREALRDEVAPEVLDRETARVLLERLSRRRSDRHKQIRAYLSLASLRDEAGEDFLAQLTAARRCQLHRYREQGRDRVEILTAEPGDACDACVERSARILTVEEALETMPLPNPACTAPMHQVDKPYCRCSYVPVIDVDVPTADV